MDQGQHIFKKNPISYMLRSNKKDDMKKREPKSMHVTVNVLTNHNILLK